MSKAYLLVICLLFASFTGCMEDEEDCCEDQDKYEIASGSSSTANPSGLMAGIWIPAYEDSMETYVQAMVDSGYEETYEGALENYTGNSTHRPWPSGMPYNETWADYDMYGWEITLVSGEGTWDVIWLDNEGLVRSNMHGPEFWNISFSKLDKRGMSKSGSKGPLEKPEQTCSGDPDRGWETPYNFTNICEPHSVYRDNYVFMIVNTGDTDIVLEWSVYGWK